MTLNTTGLGIATTSPSEKLHVVGNSYVSGTSFIGSTTRGLKAVTGNYGTVQTTGEGAGNWEGYSIDGRYVLMSQDNNSVGLYNDLDNEWMIYCLRNSYVKLYFNGAEKLETTNTGVSVTGNLGIGTASPSDTLHVIGNGLFTGNVTAYASDKRLKSNIQPLQNTLDTIKKLGGYRFDWRDDIDGLSMRGADVGLLAQELEDAGLQECVTLAPFDNDGGVSKSGQNYKTIHYAKLHGVWAQAIKEQQEIIEQPAGDYQHITGHGARSSSAGRGSGVNFFFIFLKF